MIIKIDDLRVYNNTLKKIKDNKAKVYEMILCDHCSLTMKKRIEGEADFEAKVIHRNRANQDLLEFDVSRTRRLGYPYLSSKGILHFQEC